MLRLNYNKNSLHSKIICDIKNAHNEVELIYDGVIYPGFKLRQVCVKLNSIILYLI